MKLALTKKGLAPRSAGTLLAAKRARSVPTLEIVWIVTTETVNRAFREAFHDDSIAAGAAMSAHDIGARDPS